MYMATIFKHHLIQNSLGIQSQNACGTFIGKGDKWLQLGHISKFHLLRNDKAYNFETCKAALGTWTHYDSLYKRRPWADLDLFYGKSNLVSNDFV